MTDTVFALGAAFVIASGTVFAWLRPAAVVRHPRTILFLTTLVSVAAAAALIALGPPRFRVSLDPSEEPLLPRGDPSRPVYDEAVQNFGDDDVFVIGMETGDVFTRESLAALRRVSDRIRRLPGVRAVESLVDTSAFRYEAADDAVRVDRFIEEIPEDGAALAGLRAKALADRIHPKTVVSRDARTAALNVSFRVMSDREFIDAGLHAGIAAILAEEAAPGRRFFVTGRQHIKAEASALMVRDLTRLIPLAIAVGTAVAWMATGSLRMAAIPVGASLIATLWTFGVLAYLDRSLNLITIVLAPMLICVGSVSDVHVLARYNVLVREHGDTRAASLQTLHDTLLPVIITGVTTCIGFAALLISRTPAIREFGMFSLFGVAAMTLISVTGVPAVLVLLPIPEDEQDAAARPARGGWANPLRATSRLATAALRRMLETVAFVTTRWPLAILIAWTLLTAAAIACIPRIVVDTDYLGFFDSRSNVRQDFDAIDRLLVGPVPIYVVLSGPGEGAFREPDNLRALERLQALVDATPGVSTTLSVVDLIKVLNRAVEKDDPAAERVPDSRRSVADLMFMIPKNKLRRFANTNHSKVNLLVRTGATGSAAVRALEQRLRDAIAAAELPPGITAEVTGNTIVFNRGSDQIAGTQLSMMLLTAVTIFVLMWWAFRSLRLGLVAMVPNIVPVALFFGMLGTGVAALSLPTSLIGSVALGIAIDDTSHFLVGYQRARIAGLNPLGAATSCIAEMGEPIVVTSLMLTAGYLVLVLSSFATIREFGYLSAATMIICLAGDLLMLPAILVRGRV